MQYYWSLILLGWVLYRELTHASSTTTNFREFVYSAFGDYTSPKFITEFMDRHHFSLKLPSNARMNEIDDSTISESICYLKSVRNFSKLQNIDSDHIVVMDKTSLPTSPYHKYVRHIATKGISKPRKVTPTRGDTNIVYTGLKGDGTKCPFFVQTSQKRLVLDSVFTGDEGTFSFAQKSFFIL